jgi:hypothetical protein
MLNASNARYRERASPCGVNDYRLKKESLQVLAGIGRIWGYKADQYYYELLGISYKAVSLSSVS